MEFHHKIYALRIERKYSQAEVAENIGIPSSTYQAIESGRLGLKLKDAINIAKLFKVSLKEIYNDDDSLRDVFKYDDKESIQKLSNSISIEGKEIFDFLKKLVDNQLNTKDEQILQQSQQITRIIRILENKKG